MRVAVTGASGNVGTSVLEALAEEPAVKEILGIARRLPQVEMAKVEWASADVTEDALVPLFAGADAVIHLAWAIQPSRDEAVTERINVEGSRRVFDAVARAGVGALVHASSVGAYSPGPKERRVDESWPVDGIPTSFYSRHKAAVETMLDAFERREPEVRVVRLRPGLIFKAEAGSEIRRLFAGPLLPGLLVRRQLVPFIPRVPRLRFQAVHSRDVGEAYRQAVVRDVRGAFNIAAEPAIGVEELREFFGARSFPLPAGALRAAADLSRLARPRPRGADDEHRAGARAARLGAQDGLTAGARRPDARDAQRRGGADAAPGAKSRRPAARRRVRHRRRPEAVIVASPIPQLRGWFSVFASKAGVSRTHGAIERQICSKTGRGLAQLPALPADGQDRRRRPRRRAAGRQLRAARRRRLAPAVGRARRARPRLVADLPAPPAPLRLKTS